MQKNIGSSGEAWRSIDGIFLGQVVEHDYNGRDIGDRCVRCGRESGDSTAVVRSLRAGGERSSTEG